MAADVAGDVYVLVEHPFEYTGKDGRRVAIQPHERYRLLRRSTEHWWHVRSSAPVRPAQSLDDLARATAMPPAGLLGSAGSFKACSVAGSWVCPRPLARSDSENVYEAILDVRGPQWEESPEQVCGGGWPRLHGAGARRPAGLSVPLDARHCVRPLRTSLLSRWAGAFSESPPRSTPWL
ncbi:PREDICTED: rho GTPase-activating protein 27 [Propithecus coquereli]|uniref:rho GTPase-activating protein 27 n=1 Tax=Propithecus coquereli TaxID=379532 RepID=UPI00063F0892|nr:PREDICTED: rho GTPase-activating protein 27 [Propithecus coquereli]